MDIVIGLLIGGTGMLAMAAFLRIASLSDRIAFLAERVERLESKDDPDFDSDLIDYEY